MADAILDSSAVIAALQGEPGGQVARAAASTGAISAINVAEVVSKLVQYGATEDDALAMARDFGVEMAAMDERQAELAGLFHARTRKHGVSMGDAFCLALAMQLDLPVLTTDRRWSALDLGVEVRLIR
jgi:PIN domain nuclease of toxin-antitoxin system